MVQLRQANPRKQRDLGELSAIDWFVRKGYSVYLPWGHSPDVDLVVDDGVRLARIQVKTSTHVMRDGVFGVTVRTSGGNQSWNGLVKKLDPARIDFLFVLVADGRRWLIPSGALRQCTSVTLGASKYAEYEVEPSPPLASGPTLFSADLAPITPEARR
jgi:hypothetical protein